MHARGLLGRHRGWKWWRRETAAAAVLQVWGWCGLRMDRHALVEQAGGGEGGQSVGAVIATCRNLNMHNTWDHNTFWNLSIHNTWTHYAWRFAGTSCCNKQERVATWALTHGQHVLQPGEADLMKQSCRAVLQWASMAAHR